MWNELLKNFILLKTRFISTYGEENLWHYGEYQNCVEYWSSKFEDFYEMFSPLIITEYQDFVLFRYSLLDTDAEFWNKYNQMYRECRSVVLDKKKDCLVLTPFRKFFNVNEMEETQEHLIRERIDRAKRIEVSEKLDGSMQSARYYNGEYVVSGSQALDPNMSFRVELGYSMLTDVYKKMLKENPDYTFIFEFVHKNDTHVVVYSKEQEGLYLIGVRNVATGEQLSYRDVIDVAERYGIKHTNVFDKTFEQLMSELDDKRSDEAEGFVIDIDGYKVKLKYNDYRKIHHMLSKMTSTNTIIRCIDDGSWDDVLSKIPEAYRPDMLIVAHNVKEYVRKRDKQVKDLFFECKRNYAKSENAKEDKKSFVFYSKEHYSSFFDYIMVMYNGMENNFLRSKSGRYIKYYEIVRWLELNK
jgi:hypothetical protein